MTQYFLNVPTIFPRCTEPESASYIAWHILKELNLFLPRKVLVHWTCNYNVFNKYWVSKWVFAPSVTNHREGKENVEKVKGTKVPSGETKESEESTTEGLGRQQDTRTSGGNNIKNETKRGLEDENDDRD